MRGIVLLAGMVAALCFAEPEQNVVAPSPMTPTGYAWSPNIGKPAKLWFSNRFPWERLQPGNYDFACVPIGDNWILTTVGAYSSVKLAVPGNVSVMPRFPVLEPSPGFVIVMRGPYADDTAVADRPAVS